jgi:hypothetical protein
MKKLEISKLAQTQGGSCGGAMAGCAIGGLTMGIISGGLGIFTGFGCAWMARREC